MQPILTAEAMREADRLTIEAYGLPGFTLMETAGRGAADQIEAHVGPVAGKTVACFCGKGNNGGDGFVVARVLHARGARVQVFALSGPDEMSEDAARNWHLLEQLADNGRPHLTLTRFENLRQVAASQPADVYVDALLGTGLTSALREPIRSLVAWLNDQPQPTVALDVPTGLHSDIGTILGEAVQANLTVTMGALKAGLLLGKGPTLCGEIETVEIGIPRFVLEEVRQQPGCAWYPTDAAIANWLPRRAHDAHKYSAGLALVVAGSPGMTGAPVMAALSAARTGAGFVTCACPATIQNTLAIKLTEVTTLALPEQKNGGIDTKAALDALAPRLEKARALLIGPGMGQAPATQHFIRSLLQATSLPVVIDADGLNALADDPDFITRHAEGRWILTPHAGEFMRLADDDGDLTDRIRTAQTYAQRWNCVLLLKGMPSLTAAPDGTVYINRTGNPALATAGTGDVLAGMCTGLLAQGLSPLHAAVCALHVGGAAADRYALHRHGSTMMATDLLDHLPLVLHERFA
jgi:NAD(P)H-hydrate epimerase